MFYYLFDYLEREFNLAGASLFQYISFRSGGAALLSLIITITCGKQLIDVLKRKQVGEVVRDLGLEGQKLKQGTPTMGGIIIIGGIVIPTLFFARLDNIYIILMLTTTILLGCIGFIDDYIKVFKKDKKGLRGKFKIIGQITLGLIIALTLYFHEDVVVREFDETSPVVPVEKAIEPYQDVKSTTTTIPFVKDNEFNYNLSYLPDYLTLLFYTLVVILVVTAVSNGANISDGVDGLTAGSSAIIGLTLAFFAYVSGNIIFSDYLNIMYIPMTGELVVFSAAFVGASVGFLWYNAYPAQVFMGDTGSLMLGGVIAALSLAIRKELLIPLLCGIFLMENLSVIMQVSYFKYTKKKFGAGRRIFRMSPLHHHYQMLNINESKIVTRFWIVGILLAILTLATLKIR